MPDAGTVLRRVPRPWAMTLPLMSMSLISSLLMVVALMVLPSTATLRSWLAAVSPMPVPVSSMVMGRV